MKVFILLVLVVSVWSQACNLTLCGEEVLYCNKICMCPDPPCSCCEACEVCGAQVWLDCCACVGLCDSPPMNIVNLT